MKYFPQSTTAVSFLNRVVCKCKSITFYLWIYYLLLLLFDSKYLGKKTDSMRFSSEHRADIITETMKFRHEFAERQKVYITFLQEFSILVPIGVFRLPSHG